MMKRVSKLVVAGAIITMAFFQLFDRKTLRELNMNNRYILILCVILLLTSPTVLMAQDYQYHPVLSDNFTASLGYMRSSNAFKLKSDVIGDPGDDIDFDDSLDVSDHSNLFNGQLNWKFGSKRKWSIAGQYFSNSANGDAVLEEDIEWDGLTFGAGTFVESQVKIAVTRLFVGRSFFKNDQNDFGLGIGLHNLDISAYLEGEVIVDGETLEGVQRGEVDANQPLPNIGGWYNYSPAKNWLLHARVDWISANIGDYDGGLWNTNIGVGYLLWRNVSIDLSWQYFHLNLNVSDEGDWVGGAEMTYSGPVASLIFSW